MVTYIEVKGTHKEMGIQQGEQMEEKIKWAVDELLHSELISEIRPKIVPVSVLANLLGLVGKMNIKKAYTKYLPNQHDYLLGLSKGAHYGKTLNYGLNFIEVINGNPKLLYKNPPPEDPPTLGCTMLFATKKATANKELLFARNYDFPNILKDFQMVRKCEPDSGYKNITLTHFPHVGSHQGLNEKGLVIGYNYGRSWRMSVPPIDFRMKGAPGTAIVQHVIENCATTEEAIKYITEFPMRSNGAMYGLMDLSGDACVIETTSTRSSVRKIPKEGFMAHTNTYVTEKMLDANLPMDVRYKIKGMDISPIESPIRRLKRANFLLNPHKDKGDITFETLKSILTDHDNGDPNSEGPDDFSLCTHGHTGSSLASIIVKPESREFWVTDNLPCQSEYEKFIL
ncbi:MAG: hypothetical protein GY870_20690 [archaeon]|nr:hypothetical protein [archaeon]